MSLQPDTSAAAADRTGGTQFTGRRIRKRRPHETERTPAAGENS